MTTIYKVLGMDGVLVATFVFESDAEWFIKTQAPLCHIEPFTFDKDGRKRGNKDERKK